MTHWIEQEGTSYPLGATWVESAQAYNFALYSKHAESVTLLFYTDADLAVPVCTRRLDYLTNKSGHVWHCRVARADLRGTRYYAHSIAGPAPAGRFECHRFDPDKILLDPYARSVFFPAAFDREAAVRPGSNAGKAPLGLLAAAETPFDWGDDRRPRHESDTIIYELHVRGFTNSPTSGVAEGRRGRYAGLMEKIPYLKNLGVTAVELMPVFQLDPPGGELKTCIPPEALP